MSTTTLHPLRIATIGLGEQMINALRLFFQGPCQNAYTLASENSAELSIVDLDGYEGTQRLEDHLRNFPQRPVIVLSLHEKALADTIVLRKPIKSTQLFDAIKEAKTRLCPRAEKPAQDEKSSGKDILPETADQSASVDSVDDLQNQNKKAPVTDSQGARAKRPAASTHRAAMHLDERSANIYIGSAPDINPENQQEVANAQYEPQNFLQSHLKQASLTADSKRCNVILNCPQGSITISFKSTRVLLNISEQKLRTLSTVPILEGTISLSLGERGDQLAKNDSGQVVDSEALMWKTALWASRGRVPAGTSFLAPVIMRRWPNLPKLMVFPHALRVAALWAREPYSLIDTAKYLNIPQRNVFAFYSAAHAIGLADIGETTMASPKRPSPSDTRERKGLLNRIINRLRWL
jgi:hypothetical protein